MASDGGSKGPGTSIGPNREAMGDLADEATSVIELSGVIKWFDVAKGFGFIIPDNGMPDVLLHVTCLRRDGYQTAYEGARVICGASGADAAAAHPRYRHPNQRAGARAGQMVQPAARFRLPDPG